MSSRLSSTLLAAALLLSASACVHITIAPLRAPIGMYNPDSVRVFAMTRPTAYTEIAILETHRFFASDAKVIDALRKSAARLGANAILLVNANDAATQYESGTAVVLAGRDAGTVVHGEATTKVDVFERAVAIRVNQRE